jgi:hypothetical protein
MAINAIVENMKKAVWVFGCLIVPLLIVFLVSIHRKNQMQQALPVWQPSPILISSLGQEVSMQGYGMRLPNGYEAKYTDLLGNLQSFGLDMYFWHNDRHASNASGIELNVVRRVNLHTPVDTAQYALEAQEKGMDNVSSSSIKEGQINGLPFARVYWQGTKKGSSSLQVNSGFIYATNDWTKGIIITGYDSVPCSGEPCQYAPMGQPVLPSVEAAVLTFHKL